MGKQHRYPNVLEDQYAEIQEFLKFKNYPPRLHKPLPKDPKRWLRQYLFNSGGSAPAAQITEAAQELGININDLNSLVHGFSNTFSMSYPEGPEKRCWWVLLK